MSTFDDVVYNKDLPYEQTGFGEGGRWGGLVANVDERNLKTNLACA